jgi:hypothetical protein
MLEDLGNSASKVADTLKSRGVQGVRHTVRILNPIVRFVAGHLLTSNLGMDLIVPDTFRMTLLDGTKIDAPMPQAVRDFLSAFNQGAYPELEAGHTFFEGAMQQPCEPPGFTSDDR